MSLEACPHCHEQVHETEDGCGTERCMARRAFIRQHAIHFHVFLSAHTMPLDTDADIEPWLRAQRLWDCKPEGC